MRFVPTDGAKRGDNPRPNRPAAKRRPSCCLAEPQAATRRIRKQPRGRAEGPHPWVQSCELAYTRKQTALPHHRTARPIRSGSAREYKSREIKWNRCWHIAAFAAMCQHRLYQSIKPCTPHAPCEDVQNVEYNG